MSEAARACVYAAVATTRTALGLGNAKRRFSRLILAGDASDRAAAWSGARGARTRRRRGRVRVSEAPLRAELLTAAQMGERGGELAGEHQWRRARRGDVQLLERLRHNEALIDDTCRALARGDRRQATASPRPANGCSISCYVIHEQVRKTRTHLPHGYSAQLPVLDTRRRARACRASTTSRSNAISHGDGRVDQDALAALRARLPASARR